jgi:hypothetical protein
MKAGVWLLKAGMRVLAALLLLIGAAIWLGIAPNAVTAHAALGVVFATVIAVTAALAISVRSGTREALAAFAVTIVMVVLGLLQARMLVDRHHWIVQAAHVMVGVGAFVLGTRVVRRLQRGSVTESAANRANPTV